MTTPDDLASKCAAECAKAASDFVMMREYDYAGYDREAATIEFYNIILSHFGPELAAKEQELERLRKAAQRLVKKLRLIQAVWFSAANHGISYTGPKYDKDLDELEKALNP